MGVRFPLPALTISFICRSLRCIIESKDDLADSTRYKYGTARIQLIFNMLKIHGSQPVTGLYT
jgi:hypothetical protein